MGCCSSREGKKHEWMAEVPGGYKPNPVAPKPPIRSAPSNNEFHLRCIIKGWLVYNNKHKLWCMIHENNFYFGETADDAEPRLFFCFDGCLVNVKGKELEIQTAEILGSSMPRGIYKFIADSEDMALEWYEAALKASSRKN